MKRTKPRADEGSSEKLLRIVGDVLARGERHSRRTIADRTGKSLVTADRWIRDITSHVPLATTVKEGKTKYLVRREGTNRPTKQAAVGACIAASVASLFEGTEHERNLKDARDYVLKQRGLAVTDLDRKFLYVARGGDPALPERAPELDEIIDAILRSEEIRLSYRHNSGTFEESITLEPLTLVIFDHQFYVLARNACDPRARPYPYRFSRIEAVERLDIEFTYPPKGSYNPVALIDAGLGITLETDGPIEDIEVHLREPWASYALKHRWHRTQEALRISNDEVVLTMRVRVCRELVALLLSFGEAATVEKPMALREKIATALRNAVNRYEVERVAEPAKAVPRPRRLQKRQSAK